MAMKRIDEKRAADALVPTAIGNRLRTPRAQPHAEEGGIHKALHGALMRLSAGMPKPPKQFKDDVQYRVKLNRTVSVHPNREDFHLLRPSDDVIVSGKFAETIRDAIDSAKEV